MAHDFRVFFMGHKDSMEARYTTNKGMLPEVLLREMRESFARSEEFLDLETAKSDPVQDQKQELQDIIHNAAPEELGLMLEVLRSAGKTGRARQSPPQTVQSR